MKLKQIGSVRSTDGEFVLLIDEPYRAALAELDGFGYVNVLYWCHYLDQPELRQTVSCPQPYRNSPETVGIFATRSPVRPNPIAVTASKLLGVDMTAGIVQLAYIDAEDGSPLLDIKPYHPAVDRVRDASVPAWCAHWPRWLEDSGEFDWSAEFVHAR